MSDLGTAILEEMVEAVEILSSTPSQIHFHLHGRYARLFLLRKLVIETDRPSVRMLPPGATPGQIARALSEELRQSRSTDEVTLADVAGKVLYLGRYTLGGPERKPMLVCASNPSIAKGLLAKHWHVVEAHVELSEPTEEERGRHAYVVLPRAAGPVLMAIDEFFKVYGRVR
jgi:hypothetical protein